MKQISTDFQGWPINALTLKEILLALGFKEENRTLSISIDNPILEAYPRTLEDDGMAYGVNTQYITEADADVYDHDIITVSENYEGDDIKRTFTQETIKVFNLFRDVPEKKLDINDEN